MTGDDNCLPFFDGSNQLRQFVFRFGNAEVHF